MKQTVKMSRTIGTLEKMYRTINADKFDNELPECIITVQDTKGAYGHFTPWQAWRKGQESAPELNIGAATLDRPIEDVVTTLIHEMVHCYCYVKGIQDCSRGGSYHNSKFAKIAEEKGLTVIKVPVIGHATRSNDEILEYCINKGWSEIQINRGESYTVAPGGSGERNAAPTKIKPVSGKATSHSIKYQCEKCKNSVRATKAVNIACMDCDEPMNRC